MDKWKTVEIKEISKLQLWRYEDMNNYMKIWANMKWAKGNMDQVSKI